MKSFITSKREVFKSSSAIKEKKKRKLVTQGSFRRVNVQNEAKARNNKLIMQANTLLNEVLESLNDPNKLLLYKNSVMRDKTLIKHIYKVYFEFSSSKTRDYAIAFHL